MATARGFSVRIFIPSGDPDGVRIVEKSNWTGQAIVFPRALFPEVRSRDVLQRAGVYILWGPGESGRFPRVYVGEGDAMLPRLDSHHKAKDFWTHGVVFSSKDQNLNKAHVQYLEARLVALAADAKRCELDNGNVPQLPSLSEPDAADAEGYLADLLLCLPIVGVSVFDKPRTETARQIELFLSAKGVKARGYDGAEGFVVRAGSGAVREEAPSIHANYAEIRATLLESGVLVGDDDAYRFTQDYSFDSPSMASGVVLGRSSNGRQEWKDATGRTLREIQDESGDG